MFSTFSLTPLLRLFGKRPTPPPAVAAPTGPREYGYAELAWAEVKPVLTGDALLKLLGQAPQLEQIRELMGLPAADWQACCLSAIRNFAEAVQLAPASEAHHHAFCGGLLVHTLDAIVYALKLRRRYQLPAGAGAERLNEAASRWSYGVFCAVLLHDPGKVGATVSLMAETAGGTTRWSALNGSMLKYGITRYRLTFTKAPYRLHNQVGLALFTALLPEPGRQWLSADSELLQQLLAAVYDVHAAGSGAIGEILVQADGMSVAANLGQTPARGQTTGAKSIPLVDKYMRTLRQLIASNKFVTNKPGAQLFVTKKRKQAETDADCWILCRSAAEAVIAELRQVDASVPTAPERFYDTLQEHGMCELTPARRAIWTCSVHSADWTTEFSMLRFKARRLFGPGHVPAAFSGAVKPNKQAAAPGASRVPSGNQRSAAAPAERNREAAAPADCPQETAPAELLQETVPEAYSESAGHPPQEAVPTASVSAAPALPSKAGPTPTVKQAALLASLLKPVKGRRAGPTVLDAEPASAKAHVLESMAVAGKSKASGSMALGEAAPRKPKPVPAPTSSTGIALAEAFFAWVKEVLKREETEINTQQAIFHYHADGLLMVTPRVYQTYAANDWMEVQAAAHASSYLLSVEKRHVHHYVVKSPSGQIGTKTLACGVVLPAACTMLFGKLGEVNPFILGRK